MKNYHYTLLLNYNVLLYNYTRTDTDNQKLDSDSGHHTPFLYTLQGILKQIHCHKLIVKSINVTLHQNKKSGNKEKIPSFFVMEYLAKFVFTEVVKVGDENVGEPS